MNERLERMSPEEYLTLLKPLTLNQYDDAKAATLARVTKLIGDKPTRKKLQRDQGSLFTPLDLLALVVFVAALLVSSIHIITLMGELATTTYVAQGLTVLGIHLDGNLYAVLHQLGFIFLAEASMLLFMVTWRMQVRDVVGVWFKIPRKLFSVYLLLALLAMSFVLSANLKSGLSLLEAIMPPIFTIGLGLHMEHLIVELIDRRQQLTDRLQEKLAIWEEASEDPSTHPEYRQLLVRELWEKLAKLAVNRDLADVPGRLKLSAVHRELERDAWTVEAMSTERQITEYQRQLGVPVAVAEDLVLNEGDLFGLADLVQNSTLENVGDQATISTPAGSANLETMTWRDAGQNGREYGPYTNRARMASAIRSVARTNTRRA